MSLILHLKFEQNLNNQIENSIYTVSQILPSENNITYLVVIDYKTGNTDIKLDYIPKKIEDNYKKLDKNIQINFLLIIKIKLRKLKKE